MLFYFLATQIMNSKVHSCLFVSFVAKKYQYARFSKK